MPAQRKPPVRGSQQRSAKLEEPPMRTRSGRGAKSAATKAENGVSLKTSPHDTNGHLATRKRARRSSDISDSSSAEVRGVQAKLDSGRILIILGLQPDYLRELEEKDKRNQRKERLYAGQFTHSDLENETSSGESDVPTPPPAGPVRGTRGRGRGRGRGSRGGRGRGRWGASSLKRETETSPVRMRKPRTAAPAFPLREGDDESSTNQESSGEHAKNSPQIDEDVVMGDNNEYSKADELEEANDVNLNSNTPLGSPPQGEENPPHKTLKAPPVPAITLPPDSTSQTPLNGGSPAAATPVPQLINPEDDVLADSDLPGPWIEDYKRPTSVAECDDHADFLLKTRFKPMTEVHDIIATLTKFHPSQRSTENLYRMAENTQFILKAWQDEYLKLDARTAPHAHPPKKPANGGRVPVNPLIYEDMKEADLYGYVFDAKKPAGAQDPFAQRIGAEKSGGRELRRRRTRDMFDSAAPSEEEEDGDKDARGAGRRQRRTTRRFDPSEPPTGTNTPKKQHNGWGGARKRGVSKYTQEASETPEPDGRAAKRVKVGGTSIVHHRIREMREESAVTSSGEEGSAQDASDVQPTLEESRKRGRPAGSKNTGRRSDYGIKKGPRKKNTEISAPLVATPAPPAPPPLLQSLSEGQNQFSIEPRPSTPTQHGVSGPLPAPPMVGSLPVSTVFQATPQPPGMPDPGIHLPPPHDSNPDAYMNTTPLSQYSSPYADGSSLPPGSDSKRKPRVKSEKRSASMTIWWAERKARQKELEDKSGGQSSKSSTPKPSSRRGGRGSPYNRPEQPPPMRSDPINYESYPTPPPPQSHTLSAPPPHMEYAPVALQPPPSMQPSMFMQSSPLAAIPTGPPPTSAPLVPRPPMPALAPAPMPPQLQSYPSPYGPRTAPRPKSSGPPPLAPAPAHTHISPYAPTQGPVMHREVGDIPFKVLVPAPMPVEESERRV